VGNSFHFHGKDNKRALVKPLRLDLDLALVGQDDGFADGKAESESLLVELVWVFEFAVTLEEPRQVGLLYPLPSVLHVHHKQLLYEVEAGLYRD